MPSCNKAQEYVKEVCQQIRWKKAHAVVEEELFAHIEDQQEALMAEGRTAEDAERLAVREMGDPLDTGSKFDLLYRPRVEWNVLLFVGLLVVMGVALRVTLLTALGEEFHLVQDLWGLPVGLVLMILGYWLDYTTILSGGMKTVFIGMVLIAIFSFVLYQGPKINGSYPYPVYLTLFWPLVFCTFVYELRGKGTNALLYSYIFMFLSVCVFLSTHVIGLLLMLGTACIVLLYALWKDWFGCSRWWVCTFFCLPLALVAFILKEPYRVQRIYAMLDPFSDPLRTGYVSCKVLTVLQQAKWIGASSADLANGRLPDASINYLLTTALHQFGWLAVLIILVVYALLITACYLACRKVKSLLGKMVVVAITTVWLMQLLFYGLTNFTALQSGTYPLLFVQGNLSMICNLFLLGVFLSVYKTGAIYRETVVSKTKVWPKQNVSLAHALGRYLLSIGEQEHDITGTSKKQ